MCGIGGASLRPEDGVDAVRLARALLAELETRGRDASGVVWGEGDEVWFDKAPTPGRTYARRLPMTPLAHTFAVHTRWATHGSPKDNRNNHPFSLNGVTGIHNGIIRNHEQTFRRLGVSRTSPGGCDSEAIFADLAYGDHEHPVDSLRRHTGDAAVAWIETERPRSLHVARLNGRPLAMANTPGGSLLFASTRAILTVAARRADVLLKNVWDVPEWTYLRYRYGAVADVRRFQPNRSDSDLLAVARDRVDARRADRPRYEPDHQKDRWPLRLTADHKGHPKLGKSTGWTLTPTDPHDLRDLWDDRLRLGR